MSEYELRDGVCCFHCHSGRGPCPFKDAVYCRKLGKDVLFTRLCKHFVRKEKKE